MSYQPAYHTSFDSLDGRRWNVVISINADDGETIDDMEISLEGDEPCIIEWAETDKQDVVQASTCTLRVSNESDRQMVQLMTRRDAVVSVGVDGHHYWFGHLDDSIYEEPYSFVEGYVTELVFSDFGILSRKPFTLTGKQCVWDIVADCLELVGSFNQLISLVHPKELVGVELEDLYINADRFRADGDGWGEFTSKREALEEVLRPLGLRIIQKNGRIWVYDIEWMRDHDELHKSVCWKGTDAYLRGSETYGWYEVGFEPDAEETLAGGEADYDENNPNEGPCFAYALNPDCTESDDIGFRILADLSQIAEPPDVDRDYQTTRLLRTTGVMSDTADICIAWRAWAKETTGYIHVNGISMPVVEDHCFVNGAATNLVGIADPVFTLTTGYIPIAPNNADFQLRINLDFLFSFRPNPFDKTEKYPFPFPSTWMTYEVGWQQRQIRVIAVPVKLELLNDDGTVAMHYVNVRTMEDIHGSEGDYTFIRPGSPGEGKWYSGPASGFYNMILSYYDDSITNIDYEDEHDHDYSDCDPMVKAKGADWATNQQTLGRDLRRSTLLEKRDQGEYVPMPSRAGRLRLTVSNGICGLLPKGEDYYHEGTPDCHDLCLFFPKLRWQLYRNPEIAIVRKNRVKDGIPTGTVYERQCLDDLGDKTSETLQACTWKPGVAPSARGLYFNERGIVYEQFLKNGQPRTLGGHRLHCHEDQTFYPQPVLLGTAELNTEFIAYTDASTPGVFLVTAQRQDMHLGTEELTMARIAGVGGFVYELRWSCPVCVREEEMVAKYSFFWNFPVCTQEEQQQLNN